MIKVLMVDNDSNVFHTFLDIVIHNNDIHYHFLNENEEEISSYLKSNNVNAVFMPFNNHRLAKAVISSFPNIKIVFTVEADTVPPEIKDNVVDVLEKPFDGTSLRNCLDNISRQSKKMKVVMFNNYDCFINDKLVNFSSKKSKELFALLLINRGKTVTMDHAITCLWPDKDIDKSKILYRDAVWRLRQVLDQCQFPCVNFGRALLSLNTENITCDYYDYLDGKINKKDTFYLLKEYDWISEYIEQ